MPLPFRRRVELRHIVDVDGQLIGVDSPVATPSHLLARAGIDTDRVVSVISDRGATTVADGEAIVLSEHEVLFLRSEARAARPALLLAA